MNEAKHADIEQELELKADHYFAVTIINGEIFVDVQVEGFTEKVALIDNIEKHLAELKKS